MPEPGVPAYHLYLEDRHEAFLAYEDFTLLDHWHLRERFMGFLFDLHAHLMAGRGGETVGGAIGLAGAVMAVTGICLWWPVRRRFALANLKPRDLSRRALLLWHRDTGMLFSPLLLLLLLTGSGMVFHGGAQKLFNGMFGDGVPVLSMTPPDTGRPVLLPKASMLDRARQHFPDARLTLYYPPTDGSGLHAFRLKQSCELHPNGRSYLYLDTVTGEGVHKADACVMPRGQRLANAIYPLHSAKTPSGTYKVFALLGSLVLAALAATGVITYMKQLMRRSR